MRFARLLFVVCFSVFFLKAPAQVEEEKEQRILLLLDGSSSMLQPWAKDEVRFKTAGKIIASLIDSIYKVNNQVEFGLRVYGHQHPAQDNNCFDTKREVMYSKDNLTQMELRLESLHPAGVSPIAYSIKEAVENDMPDTRHYNYSLILITDGGESCGGNICDVVRTLLEKKINFKPYIVSLVDYAPLKEQYNCMGSYLLVTQTSDIPKAVGTIVDGYKKILTLTTRDKKLLQQAAVSAPSALKVNIPTFKVPQTKQEEPVPTPVVKQQATPPVPKPKETPAKEIPATPQIDLTKQTQPVHAKEYLISMESRTRFPYRIKYETPSFRTVRVPVFKAPIEQAPPVVVVQTPPPVVKPPVTQPAAKPKDTVAVVAKPPVAKPKPKKDSIIAVTKPPSPHPQPKPKVVTTSAETAKPKLAKFTVQREETKETTLEIYFTDGKGKFYQTNPQVILRNPKTNAEVKKFYRTVNATGYPDPQENIPPGTYNLTVTGKSNLLVPNIEIKPNNKNKYIIEVGKASLRFEYEDDPTQPVAEYAARIKKNFEPGPVGKQLCTQEVEYEPGNYHIEINTLPIDHRSVDLEFGAEIVIKVEKPGYVQFTNTNNIGQVTLYYQLGDQFVNFYKMDISGDPEKQKLRLQRGNYRVGFRKFASSPTSAQEMKDFNVKTNLTTEIEID
ncbi:MAG: VWA domain-containing protein [Sphingobacteriales bacterium]|nr:MAG: VWA domain-containing protein [Sphingobacteriales bacterium]